MRERVIKKEQLYEFAEKVKTELEVYYGSGYVIELRDILQNNDSQKCGLIIKEKKINIAPAIYLESYYEMFQSGKEVVDVCAEIIKYYEQTK